MGFAGRTPSAHRAAQHFPSCFIYLKTSGRPPGLNGPSGPTVINGRGTGHKYGALLWWRGIVLGLCAPGTACPHAPKGLQQGGGLAPRTTGLCPPATPHHTGAQAGETKPGVPSSASPSTCASSQRAQWGRGSLLMGTGHSALGVLSSLVSSG